LNDLETRFQGDLKKLVGAENKYRLRVGNHRVLFRLAGSQIQVYAVKDRKEAYE
jgi:mRNA-degrading endonuclease RelE of RelBE toxin-antitoxin system